MNDAQLTLTTEWDKTFPASERVRHAKVTFHNRYGITLAADLYQPADAEGPYAALAVCGPFGAVKEQCAGLYAQTMAERGFLAIAFDPSFCGESGGEPQAPGAAPRLRGPAYGRLRRGHLRARGRRGGPASRGRALLRQGLL